jgi:hypothetical protein
VGGTIWAASPHKNRRPQRIGSATKDRSGAMDFSMEGPVTSASGLLGGQAALQFCPEGIASLQSSTRSSRLHWM